MDSFRIRVTPSVLNTAFSDVSVKLTQVQEAFAEIHTKVSNTATYWEGDGHNSMVEYYSLREDDYIRIFNGFRQHIDNLKVIAGVYDQQERINESVAMVLPSDVIE